MVNHVQYSEEWFRDVIGLEGEGLDPRSIRGAAAKIYEKACVKVWGARYGHNGFLLKNNVKDPEFNATVLNLWQQVFQKTYPPAGKITFQFAAGAIASRMKKKVNWARYACRVRSYGHNSHKGVTDQIDVEKGEGDMGVEKVDLELLTEKGESGELGVETEVERGLGKKVDLELLTEKGESGELGVETEVERDFSKKVDLELVSVVKDKSVLEMRDVDKGKNVDDAFQPEMLAERTPNADNMYRWTLEKDTLFNTLTSLEDELGEIEHINLQIGTHLTKTKEYMLAAVEKRLKVVEGRCEDAERQVKATRDVEGTNIQVFCDLELSDALAEREKTTTEKNTLLLKIAGLELKQEETKHKMASCLAHYNVGLYEYFNVDCKLTEASETTSTLGRKRNRTLPSEMSTCKYP